MAAEPRRRRLAAEPAPQAPTPSDPASYRPCVLQAPFPQSPFPRTLCPTGPVPSGPIPSGPIPSGPASFRRSPFRRLEARSRPALSRPVLFLPALSLQAAAPFRRAPSGPASFRRSPFRPQPLAGFLERCNNDRTSRRRGSRVRHMSFRVTYNNATRPLLEQANKGSRAECRPCGRKAGSDTAAKCAQAWSRQ